MPPDYVKPDPRPRNPRGGGGSGPKPPTPKPSRVLVLAGNGGWRPFNTTSQSSKSWPTSGTKRKVSRQPDSNRGGSSRKPEFDITEERQIHPKEHCPRGDLLCGPDEDLDSGMEAAAQKCVPDGLLCDELRQDVRMLMITGLTYEEALKLLHGGDPIHHLLPGYMVQLMLAQMIYWGTLDLTPWSKYVPESNYLDAERIWTGIRVVDSRGLEKWSSLDKCDRKLQKLSDVAAEVEMINGALSESSDDETQDPSFSLKPGAEEADNAQETRDEAEDLDDGAEEVPTNVTVTSPKTANQVSPGTRRPSPALGVRHPTDLATRDFQSLGDDELLIIEV
ncbi:hypothetical protein PHMEG_00017066 [Phytophthora megakarya]|uniref:Uncharacterized protein n=1 Tax=Phytophthora megakarya TaxID=4795 RepID=A0A225VYB5_9STRA|nr:hypothetical protein PHMEG_00017066 [Phytophthora megakarya]